MMNMRADDVVMCSLAKGGTTWVHRILQLLLHGIDDAGVSMEQEGIGTKGQVYPEAITVRHGAEGDPALTPQMDALRKQFFGEWSFEEDLCGQPSPRLFSTHLYGELLPADLLAKVCCHKSEHTRCEAHPKRLIRRGVGSDSRTEREIQA